jgi:hypothetical protein
MGFGFAIALFYSVLCRINTCGNLPPVITVFDMAVARSRASRSPRHPITFGGLVVIPTGLRHSLTLHVCLRFRGLLLVTLGTHCFACKSLGA